MIRPLRIIHRQIFFILVVSLPLLIVTALLARRPERPARNPAAAHASEGAVGDIP